MRYLQSLAIVLLLALAIADHWPSRDADAALPMSAYATKQGVCKMVERMRLTPPYYLLGDDIYSYIENTTITKPQGSSCLSLFR